MTTRIITYAPTGELRRVLYGTDPEAQLDPGDRSLLDPTGAAAHATHCVVDGALVERAHLAPAIATAPGLATLTWPEPVTARVTWRGAPGPAQVATLEAAEPLELATEVPDTAVVELDVPHRGRWEVAIP